MVWWLFKKKAPVSAPNPVVEFVEAVAEKEEPKFEINGWRIGYLYEIKLYFRKVVCTLTFNIVRREWELEIIAEGQNIFFNRLYDRANHPAAIYLVNKYDLRKIVREAIEQKDRAKKEEAKREAEIIARYTKRSS